MLRTVTTFICGCICLSLFVSANAQEVDKGKIPADQLASSFTQLPWGSPVWDVDEALSFLKGKDKALWIDTRPESFFKKGTVVDAVLLPYDKKGADGNGLTQESLAKALKDAGLAADSAKIIAFCQGPKCHRSYNATFIAVTEWGYAPENVIWFRAGYPHLLKEIKGDAKLKRKAKKYISEAGLKQL